MTKGELVAGALLALAAVVFVMLGESLDLGIAFVVILGIGLGAVIALVPHASLASRVVAFAVGLAVAWVGYALRVAVLPDTSVGRAVTVAGVILVLTAITAIARGRLPFWSVLLGAAGFAGAYEHVFAENPPLFATESVSTMTSLLLAVVVGLVVTVLCVDPGSRSRSTAAEERELV
ncbi:hypothetical protein EHW97_06470 [Aeromicrobium camelliae]|uniref:Uncharacterized protein n=1 Tax=Aeromicrobium camelliae TaxID=1538144 RepID=A0A3N6YFE2_9ACTN|nr:hypothetical protein [Aeromicrobium camelliae]RQN08524.1 hypothetical protein EHW97_06470 [Aeromicrobium camelliae]